MGDLKPKRGFVYVKRFDEDACVVWCGPVGDDEEESVPVLVVPDPDRDPTPQEIEALAVALFPCATPSARVDWPVQVEVARAAWRLGARVPS